MQRQSGITERLAGFVLVVVVSAFALRWAYEQVRPVLPLLVILAVLFGLWRVVSFLRSRRL
jgi:uncharacterized membrane protein YqjE